ncbi:MAG: DUF4215 domain-containing protein [Nannocystaceae bacterium]|nr:DUF4215 domain-containing protein [Nannocystaceae bacterium]
MDCRNDGGVRSRSLLQGTSLWLATVAGLLVASDAVAANVLVVSNSGADAVASDFELNTSHTYDGWDANNTPTLATLQMYDAVLLFENGNFGNAAQVGDVVAQYVEGGGGVVTATFFLQDYDTTTWGALNQYDPFVPSGGGCEYNSDDMDATTVVDHPITAGVMSVHGNSYRGGAAAKVDAQVLALWTTPNPDGGPDPVVGIRDVDDRCVIGISVFPDASYADFSGDVYLLFDNALTFAVDCGPPGPCGNGVTEPEFDEACDDGNYFNTDACVHCQPAACGDGFLQAGVEPCDDGNDGDNTNDCLDGCIAPSCGDGFVQAGVEACDDGNADDTDICVGATCTLASCGDGFLHTGIEDCDDGNDIDGDGCSNCNVDAPATTSGGESSSSGSGPESSTSGSSGASGSSSGESGGSGGSSGGVADTSGGGGTGSTGAAGSSSGGDDPTLDVTSGSSDLPARDPDGCACNGTTTTPAPWWLLTLPGVRRRRRLSPASNTR